MSLTHPANDLRRKILLEKLKNGGSGSFSSIFTKHTRQTLTEDFTSPLVLATPDKDQIANDMENHYRGDKETAAVLGELHESIQKIESIVYQHVGDFMVDIAPEAIYTSAKFDADLSEHLPPMLAAIPPLESGTQLTSKKPTTFASIINIGCVVSLTKLDELRVRDRGNGDFGAETQAATACAKALGSPDPFTVDFDPRWVRRFLPDSVGFKRYLDHVIEQTLRIITTQEVKVLFITPKVLSRLKDEMTQKHREAILGIHFAGMELEQDPVQAIKESFPNAVYISGYGNTLFGMCPEFTGDPTRPLDYYPIGSRLIFQTVPLDPEMSPEEKLKRP